MKNLQQVLTGFFTFMKLSVISKGVTSLEWAMSFNRLNVEKVYKRLEEVIETPCSDSSSRSESRNMKKLTQTSNKLLFAYKDDN